MPTDADNIQYLYLVLTHDGAPTIDWDAVGAVLDLKKGAVTKRWSRLKSSMEKGESPSGSTYQFLWLCAKHSKRDTPMNWPEIAAKCNTTPGAASKRYSRMKQAFEADADPPGTSSPRSVAKNMSTKAKATPKKNKATTTSPSGDDDGDGDDVQATPTPKRKRAPPKKKTLAAAEEQKFKTDPIDEDASDEEMQTPKRAKAGKGKVMPKPKRKTNGAADKKKAAAELLTPTTEATEATTFIKGEDGTDDEGDEQETFYYTAEEHVEDMGGAEGEHSADARVQDWLCSSD